RDRRRRRQLPGRDLAALHAAGDPVFARAGLPEVDGRAGVEAAQDGAVREGVRPGDDHRDHDHDGEKGCEARADRHRRSGVDDGRGAESAPLGGGEPPPRPPPSPRPLATPPPPPPPAPTPTTTESTPAGGPAPP